MKLGLTALRATLGAVFFAHGVQKLFGWFGGHGLEATAGAFESMGLRPGKRTALIAGASEAGGGALLGLGLLTPLGSAAVIGVMDQAVRTVHLEKGFFVTNGGFEYNLTLVASALVLADSGPGPWSLDEKLGLRMTGRCGRSPRSARAWPGRGCSSGWRPRPEPEPPATPESAPEAVPATAA